MKSPAVLDGRAVALWARACASRLTACKQEINALNVFPVPDSDTGSNMAFTMQSAVNALGDLEGSENTSDVAAALARGATAGARGNSGLVISQLLRGLADASRDGEINAEVFHTALVTAQSFVRSAIADPVEGTVITVLRSTTNAVNEFYTNSPLSHQADLPTLVALAHTAADVALQRTPSQLPILRHAGVVDAGARGLVVMLECLDEMLTAAFGPNKTTTDDAVAQWMHTYFAADEDTHTTGDAHTTGDTHIHSHATPAGVDTDTVDILGLEVMFSIRGADSDSVRQLLTSMGDSVVVVPEGPDSVMAHVHTQLAGQLIEAAWQLGQVSQLRIEVLHTTGENLIQPRDARTLVTLVPGSEWAETFRRAGSIPVVVNHLDPRGRHRSDRQIPDHLVPTMLAAVIRPVLDPTAKELIIVTNGCCSQQALVDALELIPVPASEPEADELSAQSSQHPLQVQRWEWADSSAQLTIVDTPSTLAGLAALAVHDPSLSISTDVASMAEAASDVTTIRIMDEGDHLLSTVIGSDPAATTGLAQTQRIDNRTMTDYCTELFSHHIAAGAELLTVVAPTPQLSANIEAIALQLQQEHRDAGEWEITITEVPGCGAVYIGCE